MTAPADELARIIERHSNLEGPLLPILHDVQARFGAVSEAHILAIALALNLSRAEVSGVVGFYHDFRRTGRDKPVIKLCRAEACQARGVEALVTAIGDERRVEIETVYCLGLCSVGPAALIGAEIHARLTGARLGALIDQIAAP